MSTEQQCPGIIGENIEVTIHFDYTPASPQAPTEPPWNSTVEISAVRITSYDPITKTEFHEDIVAILSENAIDEFKVKCHEYMDNPERS